MFVGTAADMGASPNVISSDRFFIYPSDCASQIVINRGEHMKGTISLLLIVSILLAFAGVAIAKEMSGQVTTVKVEKAP